MRKQKLPSSQAISEANAALSNISPKSMAETNAIMGGKGNVPSPQALAEANAAFANAPQNSGGKNIVENAGKSILAGLGEGVQAFAKSGNTPSGLVGQKISNQMKKSAAPLENYNISTGMNIPNTTFQNAIQGLFKSAPQIAAGIMSDGTSLLPEMGLQGTLGAALNPNHPIEGAATGAITQGAGSLLKSLSQATPVMAMKNSISRLVPFAKNLMSKAQEGYQVLDKLGDAPLLEATPGKLGEFQKFSGINNPEQAAAHLQLIKNQLLNNNSDIPGMEETINSALPSFRNSVESKLDPNTLAGFNQTFKGGAAHSAFQNFAENPSAKNAGITMRALSRARVGKNPDTDAILSDMRDQIKDNIISPGVGRLGSAADVEKYSIADMNYRQFKKFFGNSPDMENIANGNVSINTLKPASYFNILKNVKNTGAFNSSWGESSTLPMQEYNTMESKVLPQTISQHLIANKPISKTINAANALYPSIRAGILGLSNMN